MSQELHYTSAPKGLKPGVKGYCTVASTPHLPGPLAERLESLSGYRQVFAAGSPESSRNPVAVSHLRISLAGQDLSVVSRVASAGLDYTERSNKYAHHVVLAANERPAAGPAWLAMRPGFLDTAWEGEPRILPSGRKPPMADAPPLRCHHWEQLAGDPGWAGVLAESFLADPRRTVFLIRDLDQDLLPLFAEAIALVPPSRRWEISFSTYFTSLPQGINCLWRGVLKDSTEATQAARSPESLILNLTQPMPTAEGGPLVEQARTGVAPTTKHRPAPTPAAAPSRSITTAIEPTPELVELQDDPQDPFLQEPPLTRPAPTGYEAQPYTLIPELPPEMPRNSPFGKANKGKGGAGKTIKRFAPMAAVAAVFLTIGLAAGYWAGQNARNSRRLEDAGLTVNQVQAKPAPQPRPNDEFEKEHSTVGAAKTLGKDNSQTASNPPRKAAEVPGTATRYEKPKSDKENISSKVEDKNGDSNPTTQKNDVANRIETLPKVEPKMQEASPKPNPVSITTAPMDLTPYATEFFGEIGTRIEKASAGEEEYKKTLANLELDEAIASVELLGWDDIVTIPGTIEQNPKKQLSVESKSTVIKVGLAEAQAGDEIAEFSWKDKRIDYLPLATSQKANDGLKCLKECVLKVTTISHKSIFYTLKAPHVAQTKISFKNSINGKDGISTWQVAGQIPLPDEVRPEPWGYCRDLLIWIEKSSTPEDELTAQSEKEPNSWIADKTGFGLVTWKLKDPRQQDSLWIKCVIEPDKLDQWKDISEQVSQMTSRMTTDKNAKRFHNAIKTLKKDLSKLLISQRDIVAAWLESNKTDNPKNVMLDTALAKLQEAIPTAIKQLEYQQRSKIEYGLCVKVGDHLYFVSQPQPESTQQRNPIPNEGSK